jgi:two-component system alkaline phosphatase synthesis response regulator PhoP
MEFKLLKFMMQQPGRVFTRRELLSGVWETEHYGNTRTVDVHVRRLRFKLGMAGRYLRTVTNVGYGLAGAS